MKEELLNKSIDKLLKFVEATTSFIGEQAPLYAEEFLKYNAGIAGFWITTSIVIAVMSIVVLLAVMILSDSYDDELRFVTALICGAMFISFTIVGLVNKADLIKTQTAPRVVLLEHLGSLRK